MDKKIAWEEVHQIVYPRLPRVITLNALALFSVASIAYWHINIADLDSK